MEKEFIMDEKKAKWGDEKEFNLSEYEEEVYKCKVFYKDRVKEFIKRLKNTFIKVNLTSEQRIFIISEIDKLAGDKLI